MTEDEVKKAQADAVKIDKWELLQDVALRGNPDHDIKKYKNKCGIAAREGFHFMELEVGFMSDAHAFWMELFMKIALNKQLKTSVVRKQSDLKLKRALRKLPAHKRKNARVALADKGIGLKAEEQTKH